MTPTATFPSGRFGSAAPSSALTADQLRSTCAPDAFEFATTADVAVSPGTVGQGRAIEALELGLELRRSGYHVFVSGPEGTGRTSTVASLLDRIAPSLPVPPDRAYVHRFDDPDRPELLTLPAGRARQLAGAIDELRERLRTQIPALLESRDLEKQREAVSQRYAREQDADTAALRDRLAKDGMGLVQVAIGPGVMVPDVAPLRGGEPVPAEEVEASLPARGKAAFRRRLERAKRDVHEHFLTLRDRHRAFEREIRSLIGRAAEGLVADELREVRAAFPDDAVVAFISNIERDAVATAVALADSPAADLLARQLDRYRVNVVADRSGLTGAPVMREDYPTRQNLVGTLERVLGAGPFAWAADASTIRAGSLLRADGGFFVARASDVLAEPGAWDALKRAMLNGMLQVGAASTSMLGLPRSLEPDPVPLDLKVVLIGERRLYDLLYAFDPDFRKLFGIRAEFEPDLRRTPEAVHSYAALVAKVCENEHLPHADPAALAALVEEGALLAGRGDRLTAQLSTIADIVREAAFWAGRRKASRIERVDIDEAVRRRRARDGSLEERMQELLLDGTLLVATSGASVGQVNALSVYDLGYTAFGKPTRITASVSPGRAGIINVEREARMSGGIYDKGVLIISGFLRRRYARRRPALTDGEPDVRAVVRGCRRGLGLDRRGGRTAVRARPASRSTPRSRSPDRSTSMARCSPLAASTRRSAAGTRFATLEAPTASRSSSRPRISAISCSTAGSSMTCRPDASWCSQCTMSKRRSRSLSGCRWSGSTMRCGRASPGSQTPFATRPRRTCRRLPAMSASHLRRSEIVRSTT